MAARSRNLSLWIVAVAVLGGGVAFWLRGRGHATVEPRRFARPSHPREVSSGNVPLAPTVESAAESSDPAASRDAVVNRLAERLLPPELCRQGATTFGAALALVLQLPESEDRSVYFQTLLQFGIEADPIGTLQLVTALKDQVLRDHGMGFALGAWAQRDAPAALQWAAAHPKAPNDASWLTAAYEGFAAIDPPAALTLLQRPELAGDSDALARVVLFHFAEQGRLDEVSDTIGKMADSRLRDVLVLRLMETWGRRAPETAANWLASHGSDPTFREGMGSLIQSVAATEPSFAAGLAQRFPDPRAGHDLLADVVYVWSKRDLGGATTWVRAQPPSPALDGAIARLVDAIGPNDRNEARQLITTILDPQLRADLASKWAK